VLIAILAACTVQAVRQSRTVNEELPPVGVQNTVALGEKMMEYKNYEAVTAVVLPVTRSNNGPFPIDMAGPYVVGMQQNVTYYCGNVTLRDPLNYGKVQRICFTESEFKEKAPSAPAKSELIVPKTGNIQRVLEYTGRAGDRLTFSYREYTETVEGSFIRPAYSQEFTFDLSQGNEIGVKGARLRIIKASNTEITYEIQKHFPH
jgi:hypothetical protein